MDFSIQGGIFSFYGHEFPIASMMESYQIKKNIVSVRFASNEACINGVKIDFLFETEEKTKELAQVLFAAKIPLNLQREDNLNEQKISCFTVRPSEICRVTPDKSLRPLIDFAELETSILGLPIEDLQSVTEELKRAKKLFADPYSPELISQALKEIDKRIPDQRYLSREQEEAIQRAYLFIQDLVEKHLSPKSQKRIFHLIADSPRLLLLNPMQTSQEQIPPLDL